MFYQVLTDVTYMVGHHTIARKFHDMVTASNMPSISSRLTKKIMFNEKNTTVEDDKIRFSFFMFFFLLTRLNKFKFSKH